MLIYSDRDGRLSTALDKPRMNDMQPDASGSTDDPNAGQPTMSIESTAELSASLQMPYVLYIALNTIDC
jgi:hypothetical protein